MATILNLKYDHPSAFTILNEIVLRAITTTGLRASCIAQMPDGTMPLKIHAPADSVVVEAVRKQVLAQGFQIVSEETK